MADAESASMRVITTFTSEEPDAYSFSWALQGLNIALSTGVWVEAALETRSIYWGREPTEDAAQRFFGEDQELQRDERAFRFIDGFDPYSPLDVGLLLGVTNLRREQLLQRERPFADPFSIANLEDVRRESPIVVVIAIPLIVKVGTGAAGVAAVGTVLKNIDRVFKIKKTRAEKRLIEAQIKATEAAAHLSDAQAAEARANAGSTKAQTAAFRSQLRHDVRAANVQEAGIQELAGVTHEPQRLETTEMTVQKMTEGAVATLAANEAVADVRVEAS